MSQTTKELFLYNTMTRQKMPFEPLDPAEVKLYTCGPTVYNYAHIGNLRTYIFEDFLRRTLEFNGYVVNHVMNITDVGHLTSDADEGEDKMLKGAKREKKTVWEIAEFYTKAFMADALALNLLEPHIKCKATDHIQEMIDQIKKLEENGLTYIGENGNVYFDTSKFPDYGKMAQLDKQDLRAGERIEIDKNKKHPHDFVLWFVDSKHGKQDMQWDSPWGRGFPGWHIECSAMSIRYLGNQIDIHCGGIDHIPVHHTNEIAQAEGATNIRPWVLYWMHGNFLVLKDSAKMAKSADNFIRLQTLIDRGYNPLAYRYFCLQSHYRKELTFSWEALDAAQKRLDNLYKKVAQYIPTEMSDEDLELFTEIPGKYLEQSPTLQSYYDAFESAINDDLNMPQACAVISSLFNLGDEKLKNEIPNLETPRTKAALIIKFDKVLGLDILENVKKIHAKKKESIWLPEKIHNLVEQRNKAREEKDFNKSDQLRDEIEKAGFIVKDGVEGTEVMQK